jgi:hypothetical protein
MVNSDIFGQRKGVHVTYYGVSFLNLLFLGFAKYIDIYTGKIAPSYYAATLEKFPYFRSSLPATMSNVSLF